LPDSDGPSKPQPTKLTGRLPHGCATDATDMELWGGGSLQKLRLCPHDLTNESITRYQHWLPHPRQPILASWPQLHTAGASLHNDSRTVDWVRQRAAAMKKYLSFTLSDADLAHNWDNAMQMENGTTAAAQIWTLFAVGPLRFGCLPPPWTGSGC